VQDDLGTEAPLTSRLADAFAELAMSIDAADKRGLVDLAMTSRAQTLWVAFELGRWDEVVETADSVTAWERGRQGVQLQGMALPNKARVLLLRGQTIEAAAIMQELIPLAQQIGDLQVLLPALGAAALVELAAQREESRGAHWREDFPDPSDAWRIRQTVAAAADGTLVTGVVPVPSLAEATR